MSALLRSSGFQVALLTGTGASLLVVVATRRTMRSIALGIAVVAGVLAGLGAEDVLKGALPAALLLLGLGALMSVRCPLIVRAASLAPGGALLVTLAAEGTAGWARALVFLTIIGAGPAATTLDRRFPYLTFGLLAFSALGAYATVPDTEQARALVGALLPTALLAFFARETSDPSGPTAGVALVGWVGLVGGVGRPGSVVGVIGCVGVLALGALPRRTMPLVLIVLHVAVVVFASRVAGLRESAWAAAALLVPVAIVAATVLAVSERSRRGKRP